MRILAIDPGTVMGYAALRDDDTVVSGIMRLRDPKTSPKQEHYGKRWANLRMYIKGLLTEYSPEKVVYEKVRRHVGVEAAHIYGAIEAYWAEACLGAKIPIEGIHVQHVKQRATGKGNANKEAMKLAAQERWPTLDILDDNHADALWILDTARAIEIGELVIEPPKKKGKKK